MAAQGSPQTRCMAHTFRCDIEHGSAACSGSSEGLGCLVAFKFNEFDELMMMTSTISWRELGSS